MEVDRETRCAHYRRDGDIVAIQFPCCGRFYACHSCHHDLEDHDPTRWPRDAFGQAAVLCGACRERLTISEYLVCESVCPRCASPFNPGCAAHHPFYFEL